MVAGRQGALAHLPVGRRAGRYLIAVLVALAMVAGAVACGSDSTSSSGDGATTGATEGSPLVQGLVNQPEEKPPPKQGGVLEVTLTTPPPSLDPLSASISGPTAGLPLIAIYGVLMRYDEKTGDYVGQLADSISSSPDFGTWTLKLRPGVTFSDGTPLNAEAVIASTKRLANATTTARTSVAGIASMEAPDPLTVVYHLKEPWARFPYRLATDLGMVTSPTAVQAKGDAFSTAPVGAGPFVVERFAPNEEVVLKRNPTYWNAPVYLDGIRFTAQPQPQAALDKLQTGGADLINMVNPSTAVAAMQAGHPGYTTLVSGLGLTPNIRSKAWPASDPRLRQALAMAIDPQVVNQRASKGDGIYSFHLMAPGGPYYVEEPVATYDPDKAKQLVEAVKRDTGWDGSVTLLTPRPLDVALACQALLNAVGFNVEVKAVQSYTELINAVIINQDFQLAVWQVTMYPEVPWSGLNRSFDSKSPSNYNGYANPEFDRLLDELRVAPNPEAVREALRKISVLWQTEQPMVTFYTAADSLWWNDNVHGVTTTSNAMMLFDKVYLS